MIGAGLDKATLLALIERHAWNVTAAARELQMPRHSLSDLLHTQGIDRPNPIWTAESPFAKRMRAVYGGSGYGPPLEPDPTAHLVCECRRLRQKVELAEVIAKREGDTAAQQWCQSAAMKLHALIVAGEHTEDGTE